jgi:predicted permease
MPPDSRPPLAFIWLSDLRRDLAYGVRALARTRGFTAIAMITLALGIGAVTVIYSVLRNVVLDPFPYSRSERLVNVLLKDANGRIIRGPYFPAAEYLDYQEQAHAFEDVVATSRQGVHWIHDSGAEALVIAWMTANGFDFLGVKPMIGRAFTDADVAAGAPPIGVMSYRAWMKYFGGDPAVLGRTMNLNGEARTVVGVMPPRYDWKIADLWLPAALTRADDPRSPRGFRAFQAHLRPGVTPREAEAQLNVIGKRRAAQFPAEYPEGFRFEVIAVVDWVVRDFRAVLYTLFGAVSLLLVIACCNVANMLLARATAREREISVRAALGASRGRIVRQLLVESGLLAAGGLVLGAAFAYAGIEALARYMPRQGVPWETEIRLDQPVLLFAFLAAAIATIGVGLYPALQSVRQDVVAGAGMGGRTTAGPRQTRMRS